MNEMSPTRSMMPFSTHTAASSPTFQDVFDSALVEYTKQTETDLATHPLAVELENCNSADDLLLVLEARAKAFREFGEGNKRWMEILEPTVHVLYTLSLAVGNGIGLAFPPTLAVVGGIGLLFVTAQNFRANDEALIDLFDCIGGFLKRLQNHKSFSPGIAEIAVRIMSELLSVFALATQQIKMGRFKKFGKMLLGNDKIMVVLHRLDRLTEEEARMTVSQTLEVIQGLVSNMKVVMDDGKVSTEGIRNALISMQETVENINKLKRDQFQINVRNWLRAPDPSINHNSNAACRAHHRETAVWFTEGDTFAHWRASGSTLLVYGKPGSGKSVFCSKIVEDMEKLREAGLALVLYFYFDFNDTDKQSRRALLSSFLDQLSARSDPFYDILSDLYLTYDRGARQPNDDCLMQCLKAMLNIPGQGPVYMIMDALDECPNKLGMPSQREEVLETIKDLVGLRLPNLRICVTSRPEVDIRSALKSEASHSVSLHDEEGQKQDIINYIIYVVHHESDKRMRSWRDEDRKYVIKTLSEQANGMFRWVFCQLETLRRCFPNTIRQTLKELPPTLDETYARALLGIDEEKQELAKRFFQCLTVSVRPLRAEELAEAMVVNLDNEAAHMIEPGWRPLNPEDAVLRTCSSLITITEKGGSRIVQFSHSSVKEFLISSRLADSADDRLSRYHIVPRDAHEIFAKICLRVLLQLDHRLDKRTIKNFPLAEYAAQHWVDHARLEDVSLRVQQEIHDLFDPEKPHFAAWVWIHDIDPSRRISMVDPHPTTPDASPLHYAALCGLLNLVESLAALRPQEVHSRDESSRTPLHVALHGGYTDVAQFLVESGASTDAWDDDDWTPLHIASQNGNLEVTELLLQQGAIVNTQTKGRHQTPLDLALSNGNTKVVRLLLAYGANANTRDDNDLTPLHIAFQRGNREASELLLDRRANVNARRKDRQMPLHLAAWEGTADFARLFLKRGASVNARGDRNRTPLQMALGNKNVEVVRLLLKHGADVNVKGEWNGTPLHSASETGDLEIMSVLLNHKADVNARDSRNRTPLHLALPTTEPEKVIQMLLEHGADPNAKGNQGETPLHMASRKEKQEIVHLLLKYSANVNARSEQGSTPLHEASATGQLEIVKLLLDHNADAKARTNDGRTPLHKASRHGWLEVVQLLVERGGADVDAKDQDRWTPLHIAVEYNWHEPEVALWLIGHGADVDSRDYDDCTPLHFASTKGHLEVVRSLLEHHAKVNARDRSDKTPFQLALKGKHIEVTQLLQRYGAGYGVEVGRPVQFTAVT